MANLTSATLTQKGIVLTLDDGTTQETDFAVAAAPKQVVDVAAGESVEVVNTDAPATPDQAPTE